MAMDLKKLEKERHTLDALLQLGLIREQEYELAKAVLENKKGEV